MGILGELAQYRAWRNGVLHTTLNSEGMGAVRIHLVPPRWKLFGKRPYVVILNGYYVLPATISRRGKTNNANREAGHFLIWEGSLDLKKVCDKVKQENSDFKNKYRGKTNVKGFQ